MSQDPKGYYSALGLQPGADIEQVKKAYKDQLKRFHPDFGTESKKIRQIKDQAKQKEEIDKLNDKVQLINEAKQILMDPEQKKEYDNPSQGFGSFFDLFRSQRQQPKAKDTRVDIKINMRDNYNGITKKFKINRNVLCKTCDGNGGKDVQVCGECRGSGMRQQQVRRGNTIQVFQTQCDCDDGYVCKGPKCEGCNGKKYKKEEKIVEIDIKNVKHGEVKTFEGFGDERKNCLPGDVNFVFFISDKEFKRVDDNIVGSIKLDLTTCLLGGSIEYKHLDGKKYEIKVDKIKSFKDILKVEGLGFGRGNLYLNIEVDIPNVDKNKVIDLFGKKEVNGEIKVRGTYETVREEEESEEEDARHGRRGNIGDIFSNFFSGF